MAKSAEFKRRFEIGKDTGKWAVTMTKVRIRQAVQDKPSPRWHLLSFLGPKGGESRGVVDMIAIRKDHKEPRPGAKNGDASQIILIQVRWECSQAGKRKMVMWLRLVAAVQGLWNTP